MPLARIVTNVPLPDAEPRARLLGDVSRALARLFSKPERWAMTCLEPTAHMSFGGSVEPAAYVEVKNVGTLSEAHAKEVSAALTALVSAALGVPAERVYLEMAEAEGRLWGWNGGTFA